MNQRAVAYYNEIDPFAANWLRELIKAGHIAPGIVDERSIEDVRPSDLDGFTQCHFFAGIGGWSYALRLAAWPDHRPVWTGSCPCQPFSAAGKGSGFDDERHLWPSWHWLIRECKPPIIFGEQVASKAAGPWFDLVQADVEAMDYAFGLVPFPAASVGAPQMRDRAYWMADGGSTGLPERERLRRVQQETLEPPQGQAALSGSNASRLANNQSQRRHGRQNSAEQAGRFSTETSGEASRLGDTNSEHTRRHGGESSGTEGEDRRRAIGDKPRPSSAASGANPTNGFWADPDWLGCRDGKLRPVESGTFPLASKLPARVGRLRGYGNSIVAEQAAVFIECATAPVETIE